MPPNSVTTAALTFDTVRSAAYGIAEFKVEKKVLDARGRTGLLWEAA